MCAPVLMPARLRLQLFNASVGTQAAAFASAYASRHTNFWENRPGSSCAHELLAMAAPLSEA
eukprot:4693512-Pleurochrysis_carterae.AAC.1